MATCGYVCPVCEGKGYIESGDECLYCKQPMAGSPIPDDEEWMKEVHEGKCCSDSGDES